MQYNRLGIEYHSHLTSLSPLALNAVRLAPLEITYGRGAKRQRWMGGKSRGPTIRSPL